ncbi:hypothetical protein MKZ17_12430 [Solibacillus sp. FSL R7-0682]|uniref:hypothetical protein n=1 Tax=Solibacillus sp. FSL R7-0682 TaxID=2921690 RepID=UPI0030FC45ED
MKKFEVVKRLVEKDVHVASIKANSLDEAQMIFDKSYRNEKESMKRGDAMIIAEVDGDVVFDNNHRLVVTSGNMNMFYKF